MTKEHIEKLINILGIDPKKGEWLTSAMAKSSFPESFSEGLYKHLADKKLDTYLERAITADSKNIDIVSIT